MPKSPAAACSRRINVMITISLSIILLSLSILVLSAAAAMRLLFLKGKWTAGVLLLGTVSLMMLHRGISLYQVTSGEINNIELIAEFTSLIVSCVLLAGILYLNRLFGSLDVEMDKRNRTEENLKQATARLQALIYAMPDMVIFKDREGRHLTVNKSAEEFFGLHQNEVYGKTGDELLPSGIAALYGRGDHHAMNSPVPVQSEDRLMGRDGAETILDTIKTAIRDDQGTVTGLVAVSRDITKRKQAEEQIRLLYHQMHLILNAAGEGIFGLDRTGRITFTNPAASKMTGWTVEEMVGQSTCDLLIHSRADGSPYSSSECPLRKALESGSVHRGQDEVYWRKDGSCFPVEYVSTPIKEQDTVIGAVVVFKDITKRRQAEEESRLDQRRLSSLFNVSQQKSANSQEFVSAALAETVRLSESAFGFISYYKRETREFKLQIWPETAARQYSAAEPPGIFCIQYMGDCARHQRPLIVNDVAAEKPFVRERGNRNISLSRFMTIPVVCDGTVLCVVGIGNKQTHYTELDMRQTSAMMEEVWKIAERKIAEESLRLSEERLRLALAGANQGLYDLDLQTGEFTVSPEYATMLRYDPADFRETQTTVFDRVHPDDRERVEAMFNDCLAGAMQMYTEFRVRNAVGEWQWVQSRGKIVDWDSEGKPLRLVGTHTDVTERRKLLSQLEDLNKTLAQRVLEEIEKNRAKEQLLQLQSRHAAMGEMIDNIAHQWRQPLNNLGLIIQGIDRKCRDGSLSHDALSEKTRYGMSIIHYMSQTINDFSNFFRQDKEKITFRVKDVVGTALGFMETRLKRKDISVIADISEDVVIRGFRNEYTQVVVNILNNARDVFVERGVASPRIVLTGFREKGASVLTIADNGGGIPDHAIDKIFKPYFTTKEKSRGTGIGLYMAKTIIEGNMAGRLTVANLHNGAEFRIEVRDHA